MIFRRRNNDIGSKDGSSGKRLLPFRAFDFVIIAAVLLISITPLFFLPRSGAGTVIVTWHGREIYRASVSIDAVIVTPDELNTIIIHDGSAVMSEASCKDRICILSGPAAPSRPIICLPNRVTVTIVSAEEVDGVSW
ncbi:MAG: NusG domain II-containing protein [Clostridia bacterium]|nr:NusG domain II-containing protein [Clostridia bacterium]